MILAYAEMVAVDTKVPDLVLAGRGVLALPVAELVRDLGLASKVHIRTDIGMDELVRLYQGASMFLQTSYEEGLGISILEAMACGLPVVSTDTAGTRETVVSGKTGWLVEQGSDHLVANEVAQRALTVLRGGQGSVMGAEGRDRCFRLFSHRITLGRFTSVYDYLLDGAPLDATALISPMNPGPE
jgi:glycosyltransferase involved in cell wall biosynthesis